ncbi:MAG: NUDIX domain-containing protein [Planctomycetes bacterium]|nr:NUDIX domain-containing protein [Planctomycetota bacterium]
MSDETIIVLDVAVAIIFDGPLMLVSKRPETGYYGGWWEWPGGKVHITESGEEAARRELKEEIGIQCGTLERFHRMDASYPGRRVNLTFFVGKVLPRQKAKPDAMEHQWVKPEEVREMKFLEANKPVLEKLIEHLAARRR